MRRWIRAFAASAVLCSAASLSAMTVSKLSDDAFAPLREAAVRGKIRLGIPLDGDRRSSIDVEQFEVWAPGGKVVIHSATGVERVDPPARRFYRGLVDGDRESFAFFSLDPATSAVEGLIVVRERKYSIAGRRANNPRPGPNRFDDFITASEPDDEIPEGFQSWECAIDKIKPAASNRPLHATGTNGLPVVANGISGTQKYAVTVEIETDNEFYVASGSNTVNATNYITSLTGALSTIYNRDLNTNVTQTNVHIYSSPDPWSTATGFTALLELGDYYNSTTTRTTSAVVMMSGKNIGLGIAWEAVICGTDFLYPDFFTGPNHGGPYSWCGGIASFGTTGLGSIPGVNTFPYNMPAGTQNYWPLVEYAHELGHNLGGHHTHCVAISDLERTASGFTDGSPPNATSNYVDHCFAHDTDFSGITTCFAASTDYVAGSESTFNGTIMSYCHNVRVASVPQSRFTFGQAAEPSHRELDDFMLKATGSPLGSNIVNGVGSFTISAITAPATVAPSSTGNSASISAIGGATYAWTIVNGSITAGGATNAITFTAFASGTVTLGVSAYGANKCGVGDTKTVTILAGLTPPANVTATFDGVSAVTLNWTVAAGAAKYNIYRSLPTNYTSFAKLGTSPVTPPFTDNSGLALNNAYIYKIRSTDAGGVTESSDSNIDVATTVIHTNALTVGTSPIAALDMNQLRNAASAVRTLAMLGAFSYTNSTITGGLSVDQAVDMTQVRTAISGAFTQIGLPAISFVTPTIIGGTTLTTAQQFNELRNAMR